MNIFYSVLVIFILQILIYRKIRNEEIAKCSIDVALDWTPFTAYWDTKNVQIETFSKCIFIPAVKKAEMGHLC